MSDHRLVFLIPVPIAVHKTLWENSATYRCRSHGMFMIFFIRDAAEAIRVKLTHGDLIAEIPESYDELIEYL